MQVNQAAEPLYIVKPFTGGGVASPVLDASADRGASSPPASDAPGNRVGPLEPYNPDVSYRVLQAADAFWRPSNQMKVDNTDLGKQLEAETVGARFWRLEPGQASTSTATRATRSSTS